MALLTDVLVVEQMSARDRPQAPALPCGCFSLIFAVRRLPPRPGTTLADTRFLSAEACRGQYCPHRRGILDAKRLSTSQARRMTE